MEVWQYALLFGSVIAGGFVAQQLGSEGRRWLPLLLSFSGAYILGIVALELMPEAFTEHQPGTGLWLLAGFIVQLVLESFSQGVEHGHVHVHRDAHYGYAIQVMIGLGLHAFLEGMPLGTETSHAHHDHAGHLLYGIVLHKLPAAFALTLLLTNSGYSTRLIWTCLLIFACLSPLGTVVGQVLSFDPVWSSRIVALVIGSFLHISTTILFEADSKGHSHSISPQKLGIILVGIGLAYATAH